MVFPDVVKIEVKTKAHYKCCICYSFGFVVVHHIIPQAQDGSDDIDNAVPLCVKCHDDYGGNREKRRWIREKRDFWYRFCEERLFNEDINELKKIADTMDRIQSEGSARMTSIEEDIITLRDAVVDLTNKNNVLAQSLMTASTTETPMLFSQISSGAITVSGAAIFMGKIEDETSRT